MRIMHIGTRPKTHFKLAIFFMLLGALFNALMGAVVKLASPTLSPETMVFVRNLICLVLIFPWINLKHLAFHNWKLQLIRGAFGLTSILLYFYSLRFLSLSDATLLFNTMPIFVPLVAYLWKRIPMQHNLWWGLGIAFGGILVIMHPGITIIHYASFVAIGAAITSAVSSLAVRFAHYQDPTSHILFFYFVITTVLSGFITLYHFDANWVHLNFQMIQLLIWIGLFGLGWQVCFTMAAKYAPIRVSSIFVYASVVFSMMIDHWYWHQEISSVVFVGFGLIVIGAALVVYLYKEPA